MTEPIKIPPTRTNLLDHNPLGGYAFTQPFRRFFELLAEGVQSLSDSLAGTTAYLSRVSSYVTGCTITGHDAGASVTISISAHTRQLRTGTVAVNLGSLTGKAYATAYWIYYDDPTGAGGAVTYVATTVYADAFMSSAHPDRYFVGSILTPAAAAPDTTGKPASPPSFTAP